MNATQDASNNAQNKINRQLIDYNEKQNDLIFATRKRLYQLEKIQKRDCIFLLGMNFLICTACILIAVEFGGFDMVNGEKFKITYYAKKHSKFIERNGKWDEKCKYWFSKSLKPLITYFDIDANNYRTASGSYWVKRGNDNE